MLLIGGIAAAGALLGAVGVYFNLDSRDAAEAVSPKMPTSQPGTSAQQADYDRAHSSGVKAGVFYGLGGAALLASAVLFIVTAPGEDRTVIHQHYAIAPPQGGAFVARARSFLLLAWMFIALAACSPDFPSGSYECGPIAACPTGHA